MTTVALTDALPVIITDGNGNPVGRNNARDFRKGVLASVLLPDTKADPLAVRNGVFPHDYDTQLGIKSLRIDATSTATSSVTINPGAFVSERSGQGPYLGWLEISAGIPFTPQAADPTNPRWDVLYALVLDQVTIPPDGRTDAVVSEINGTPSASPTVPTNLPDGAVKLCELYRPANDSTITTARIYDRRRSTGLVGSVRQLLPGDALTDPGKVSGEMRFRAASGQLPAQVDFWDGKQGVWRGTQGVTLTQALPGTPNSGSIVSASGITARNTQLVQMTVNDPGYPYKLEGNAVLIVNTNAGSANVYMNANSGPLVGSILNTADGNRCQIQPTGGTIFTGASTVKLVIDMIGSATTMSWGADVRNLVTVKVVPA